jgi:phosphoribosyl-AMP cyclohydrolase
MDMKFDDKGLVPAIIQDVDTGEVLMLGYMNEEALKNTLSGEDVWFYSRSRQEMWHKGATSGNYIKVRSVWKDCDSDTVLVKGKSLGPVCHTGNRTCFFEELPRQDKTGGS